MSGKSSLVKTVVEKTLNLRDIVKLLKSWNNVGRDNLLFYYFNSVPKIRYILCNEDGVIRLIDFNLQSAGNFVATGCGGSGFIKGVPVKFKKDEDEYFAVIKEVSGVDKNGFGRNVLYIFNSRSELIYQRIFEQRYTDKAIAAVSLDDSGTESLLVAGEGKVWQYKLKDESLIPKM